MSAQIPMGEATPDVLDALEIAYFLPKTPEDAFKILCEAWLLAELGGSPVAMLLEIGFW